MFFIFGLLYVLKENIVEADVFTELNSFSTYRFMKLYKNNEINPIKYCPGFICAISGLDDAQINSLVLKENEIREKFALDNLTKTFNVNWNEGFAEFAKQKTQLCLPSTDYSTIYEQLNSKELTKFFRERTFDGKVAAVEVVVGTRIQNTSNITDLINSITDYIHFFNKVNNISNPLLRRATTTYMGCGYLVAANRTHQADHMVCIYGVLTFRTNVTSGDISNTNMYNPIKTRSFINSKGLRTALKTNSFSNKFNCNLLNRYQNKYNFLFPDLYTMNEKRSFDEMKTSSHSLMIRERDHLKWTIFSSFSLIVFVCTFFTCGHLYSFIYKLTIILNIYILI